MAISSGDCSSENSRMYRRSAALHVLHRATWCMVCSAIAGARIPAASSWSSSSSGQFGRRGAFIEQPSLSWRFHAPLRSAPYEWRLEQSLGSCTLRHNDVLEPQSSAASPLPPLQTQRRKTRDETFCPSKCMKTIGSISRWRPFAAKLFSQETRQPKQHSFHALHR